MSVDATPAPDIAPAADPAPVAPAAAVPVAPATPAGLSEADFDRLYQDRRAAEKAEEEARKRAPAPAPVVKDHEAKPKPGEADHKPGGDGGPRWFRGRRHREG